MTSRTVHWWPNNLRTETCVKHVEAVSGGTLQGIKLSVPIATATTMKFFALVASVFAATTPFVHNIGGTTPCASDGLVQACTINGAQTGLRIVYSIDAPIISTLLSGTSQGDKIPLFARITTDNWKTSTDVGPFTVYWGRVPHVETNYILVDGTVGGGFQADYQIALYNQKTGQWDNNAGFGTNYRYHATYSGSS
ncbi:hypothetical protein HDU91_007323 [Kappamyces sp. JEL0680]|nr:hypothetical protein HDU91_007323 [Kappamyces sp. JEL0680]